MSDCEKLTRMKADTFRARLRLGLGFAGPVHVPESLQINDSAITHLCDALCVDGDLNLAGCGNLAALPARLIVRGKLTISGCVQITTLPETLREVFGINAAGCRNLTSVAPIEECRGPLDLTGCANVAPLRPDFTAVDIVQLGNCRFDINSIFINGTMPEAILNVACGKRVKEILSHRTLGNHPVLEATITQIRDSLVWNGIFIEADTSALVKPGK